MKIIKKDKWKQRVQGGNGIYKFYENSTLVYIGRASNFRKRFCGHFNNKCSKHIKYNKIDYIGIIQTNNIGLEVELIEKHKPKYNICRTGRHKQNVRKTNRKG